MKEPTVRQSDVLAEFVTAREAARRKGVSVATIRNWVLAGRVRREWLRRSPYAVRASYVVSWPDVERIEPAYGPGRARRT